MFKYGEKVLCIDEYDRNVLVKNQEGIVVGISKDNEHYDVYFYRYVHGHGCVRNGGCINIHDNVWSVPERCLKIKE